MSPEILSDPQEMYNFFTQQFEKRDQMIQEQIKQSEKVMNDNVTQRENDMFNKFDSLIIKLQESQLNSKHLEFSQAQEHSRIIIDRLEECGIVNFNGRSNRSHFKNMFELSFLSDLTGASHRTWNSIFVKLGTEETFAITKEIALNRMEIHPLENLKYLLDQTLRPGEESKAMIKLHEFKFALIDFEKELAEFLDITSNFSQGQFTDKAFALMMVPLLPKKARDLLPVRDPADVTELANDIRGMLANTPNWAETVTVRHPAQNNPDTPEDAAKDSTTLNQPLENKGIADEKTTQIMKSSPKESKATIYDIYKEHSKPHKAPKQKLCHLCRKPGHMKKNCDQVYNG